MSNRTTLFVLFIILAIDLLPWTDRSASQHAPKPLELGTPVEESSPHTPGASAIAPVTPADNAIEPSLSSGRKSSTMGPRRLGSGHDDATTRVLAEVSAIPLGGSGLLDLPNGQFKLTHDNDIEHGHDGKTWIGHLNDDKAMRFALTFGEGTVLGTVFTPTGRYFLQNGTLWDISTLQRMPMDMHPLARNAISRATPVLAAPKAAAPGKATTIDVLVLFDPRFGGGTPKTRIRHLVTLANQAHLDSGTNVQFHIAGIRKLAWLAAPPQRDADDDTLLDAISQRLYDDPDMSGVVESMHADLVTVMRPNTSHQSACGVGYIGGPGGSEFIPDAGVAIVNDGIDERGTTYCDEYTFAHETGHNLGSSHDRPNAAIPGHFPYSYGRTGTDQAGSQWYTIMAYPPSGMAELAPVFSSPDLKCGVTATSAVPCGNKRNDNALSIFNSAASVAAYR